MPFIWKLRELAHNCTLITTHHRRPYAVAIGGGALVAGHRPIRVGRIHTRVGRQWALRRGLHLCHRLRGVPRPLVALQRVGVRGGGSDPLCHTECSIVAAVGLATAEGLVGVVARHLARVGGSAELLKVE